MATVRDLCEQNGNGNGNGNGHGYYNNAPPKTVRMPNADPPRRVDTFSGSTRKADHTGDFWIVDRDTGEVYAHGFKTRESAEKWARRENLPYLSAADTEQVGRADPICATYFRAHPDLVLVSRLDPM